MVNGHVLERSVGRRRVRKLELRELLELGKVRGMLGRLLRVCEAAFCRVCTRMLRRRNVRPIVRRRNIGQRRGLEDGGRIGTGRGDCGRRELAGVWQRGRSGVVGQVGDRCIRQQTIDMPAGKIEWWMEVLLLLMLLLGKRMRGRLRERSESLRTQSGIAVCEIAVRTQPVVCPMLCL